jgi:DNA-binding NtrC family response regulator
MAPQLEPWMTKLDRLRQELKTCYERQKELDHERRQVSDRIIELRNQIGEEACGGLTEDPPELSDDVILRTLDECGGNRTQAAEKLGVPRRRVQRCLERRKTE